MPDIRNLQASDGSGTAVVATVTTLRAPASTTLQVDSVSNYPAQFIAMTGTKNLVTNLIEPATMQVFFGHVDGANLEIDSFAPGYTDLGSSVGDIVIIRPVTAWADELASVLSVSHENDGTLKAGTVDTAQLTAAAVEAANVNYIPAPYLRVAFNTYGSSGGQIVESGNTETMTFNTVLENTGFTYAAGVATCTVAGIYAVSANIWVGDASSSDISVRISASGIGYIAHHKKTSLATGDGQHVSGIIKRNVGDTLSTVVNNNGASSIRLSAPSSGNQMIFGMTIAYIGPDRIA